MAGAHGENDWPALCVCTSVAFLPALLVFQSEGLVGYADLEMWLLVWSRQIKLRNGCRAGWALSGAWPGSPVREWGDPARSR